jgi:hypothetical protein
MLANVLLLLITFVAQGSPSDQAKIVVLRGKIEHSDHLSQMLKVRLENGTGSRYYYIPLHAQVRLDGKPSGLLFLKEKMVVDLNVRDGDGIVIRVSGYHQSSPPPLARIPVGPFDDTDKIVRLYPQANPAMKFRAGENLRLAIPKFHLVPLAKTEVDMGKTWDHFVATVSDSSFRIDEPWPIAVVPLGTKGKVEKATEQAYEIEITEGRYKHWRVWAKKEWAYPADDAQAARKAEELAESRKSDGESKK